MTEKKRCNWSTNDPLYIAYHDSEWGEPVHRDKQLFECLILETFQSGLSWITILRKRENFREALDFFDFTKMAQYKENKIEELLLNKGIIRHKQKIRAAISNAQAFIKIQEEFGSFNSFIWAFVKGKPIQNKRKQMSEITATSDLSDKLSKELKKRGFKFVGSKVIYAFMQAIGMVNDHTIDCFRYAKLKNNESD